MTSSSSSIGIGDVTLCGRQEEDSPPGWSQHPTKATARRQSPEQVQRLRTARWCLIKLRRFCGLEDIMANSAPSGTDDHNTKIIEEFRANGGRVGGPWAGITLILVHHIGAKSG